MDPAAIKRLRITLGLTQATLAEQIGVDTSTVARYESGKVHPSVKAIARMAALKPQPTFPVDMIRSANGLKYVFDLSDASRGIAISRGGSSHVGLSQDEALAAMSNAIRVTPPETDQMRRLLATPELATGSLRWADLDYRGHLTGLWYRCLATPIYADKILVCEFEKTDEPPAQLRFDLYTD